MKISEMETIMEGTRVKDYKFGLGTVVDNSIEQGQPRLTVQYDETHADLHDCLGMCDDKTGWWYYKGERLIVETPKKGTLEKLFKSETADMVNHPAHYTVGGIETIDFIEAKMSKEAFKGYLHGQVIRYISRLDHKWDSTEDMKKAQWYLTKLIEGVDKDNDSI